MNMWTGIVLIVAIGVASEMYRNWLKSQTKVADKIKKEIEDRMTKIEARMANLETIVLEKEKASKFDSL